MVRNLTFLWLSIRYPRISQLQQPWSKQSSARYPAKYTTCEGERIFPTLQGSSSWSKNWIYMRQTNRRKKSQILIMYVWRIHSHEIQKIVMENEVQMWCWTEEEGWGLGLRRKGRQFTGIWMSECLVPNTGLLGRNEGTWRGILTNTLC